MINCSLYLKKKTKTSTKIKKLFNLLKIKNKIIIKELSFFFVVFWNSFRKKNLIQINHFVILALHFYYKKKIRRDKLIEII